MADAASGSAPPTSRPPFTARVRDRLRPELPWLLLILLSITFAEFLTGSTFVLGLLLNPGSALFLVGLYGGGVLLIREATVRWKKGWPTTLLLGMAYGIVEEGIGTKTFFGPAGVGHLAVYGHFLGVNWVWAVELTLFHAIFSIGLPILVLGLLFPTTEGRPFLTSSRALGLTTVAFIATVVVMFLFFNPHETPAAPLIVLALAVIVGLVALARVAPRGLGPLAVEESSAPPSPIRPGLRGALFGWGFFAIAWLGPVFVPIPVVVAVGLGGWALLFGVDIARHRAAYADPVAKLDFAFGALTLLLVDATVFTFFGDDGAIVAVAGTVYLFLRLRNRWSSGDRAPPPPAGALGVAAP